MKNALSIILLLALASCKMHKQATNEIPDKAVNESEIAEKEIADNPELAEIYRVDQADRQSEDIDWEVVSRNDSLREVRIYQLLDSNLVRTSKDYHNAAMIFQHGADSTAYGMAVKLMRKSLEIDPDGDKWLFAAATDRYLLSIDQPQIYGTQYQQFGDEPWKLGNMDTTQITDAERMEYGVETLAQQRDRVKQMNKKSLSEMLSDGKTIDEIIRFVKSKSSIDSEYDISEGGINIFGYNLMAVGEHDDALKIFKLNTEMYSQGYNTWDSYGECLLLQGKKEEGIEAYKKSLELNPYNSHAAAIIEANK